MANPQPTDAHLITAHSIGEAVMMRDFSKNQRKILDLILRLSWGCGKKYAYIPQQKDFKVVGIFESDIKKNLDWLELSKIIYRDGPFYWFNKDFDQWQISRVNPFDPKRLSELLSLNLNGNRSQLSDLLSHHPKISELLSGKLGNNEPIGSEITKSVTPELASSKESIKEIIPYSNTGIESNEEINKIQSLEEMFQKDFEVILKIARGETRASSRIQKCYQDSLDRSGIPWRNEESV